MSEPLFSITVETAALFAAMDAVPGVVAKHLLQAAKISADNIAREAQRRVARRTGATAERIHVEASTLGNGYVVLMGDAVGPQETARRRSRGLRRTSRSTRHQEKHVGIWLEFGTKFMTRREFFFPSARLEAGPHERRAREGDCCDGQREQ